MGLQLKRGNQPQQTQDVTIPARNKEFEGVNKEGRSINPYGVEHSDLGLGLFDQGEAKGQVSDKELEKVELKLYSEADPNDVFNLRKETEESSLRLSGQEKSSEKKKRDPNSNPWDNPIEDYDVRPRTISKPIDSRTMMIDVEEEHNPVLLISFIVVVVVFVIELITLGWVSSQEQVDVQFNLMKFQWIYSVVPIVLIVDVILVNVLYKKSVPLIIYALLLPFLYPLQRGKFTNGHSLTGHCVCWISLIAYICLVLLVGKAVNNYGAIIQVEDSTARYEAASLMDQEVDGYLVGRRIMQCLDVKSATYQCQDGVEYVNLLGYGTMYMDDYSLVEKVTYDVPTVLTFVKRPAGQYVLFAADLGGNQISEEALQFYWEEAIK